MVDRWNLLHDNKSARSPSVKPSLLHSLSVEFQYQRWSRRLSEWASAQEYIGEAHFKVEFLKVTLLCESSVEFPLELTVSDSCL